MIVNVISGQSSGYTNPNPFPGMSLAEACGMAQAYTADALNEMNMSILLNEHAYLLENGSEIEYVNEANYQLKEKIKSAIDKVTKTVSDMWDKLVNWVAQRVEDVREKLGKMSVNKKKLDDIIKNWEDAGNHSFEKEFSDWVEKGKLEAAVASQLAMTNITKIARDGTDISQLKKDIRAMCVNDNHGKANVTINKTVLQDAEEVVFNTDRTMFNDIRKAKANAIKRLNETKSDIKENDDEDKADKLKLVNAKCRVVSAISSELIKWYHAYVSQNVKLLNYAIHNKSIRNDNDKYNTDSDKELEKAMHNMAKKTKMSYATIQQRYADGDTEYTRAKIVDQYGKKTTQQNASAIFTDSRFFPV